MFARHQPRCIIAELLQPLPFGDGLANLAFADQRSGDLYFAAFDLLARII